MWLCLMSIGLGLIADHSFRWYDFHMGFGNNILTKSTHLTYLNHICYANPSPKAQIISATQSDPVIQPLQHTPSFDTNRPQWPPNCAAAHSTSLSARPDTSSRPWSTKANSPGDYSQDPSCLPTCALPSSHTRPCCTPNCSQKKPHTGANTSSHLRTLSSCQHRQTMSSRRH